MFQQIRISRADKKYLTSYVLSNLALLQNLEQLEQLEQLEYFDPLTLSPLSRRRSEYDIDSMLLEARQRHTGPEGTHPEQLLVPADGPAADKPSLTVFNQPSQARPYASCMEAEDNTAAKNKIEPERTTASVPEGLPATNPFNYEPRTSVIIRKAIPYHRGHVYDEEEKHDSKDPIASTVDALIENYVVPDAETTESLQFHKPAPNPFVPGGQAKRSSTESFPGSFYPTRFTGRSASQPRGHMRSRSLSPDPYAPRRRPRGESDYRRHSRYRDEQYTGRRHSDLHSGAELGGDETQESIKFTDPLGRTFTFPWQRCNTWKV